ncbi:hypothetical protein KBB96_00270 [Luteolibacter ambystomatis]|uniref:Cupin domain-containing protein n=1 Tax=Luteolibacter ambystomatis TaxID=2824561 RepID=A0A975G9M4_9BACT|nr:hypothetical protein [Luteolibacter ambystomatis]QUE51351.1 hypothetical protein KBB96_00270 [Luteolibacter ambystomatis]
MINGPVKQVLSSGVMGPGEETFHRLIAHPAFELEEIVSRGQASPEGFWYDQPRDEWVLLVAGRAVLAFEPGGRMELVAGNHVLIPARLQHRVEEASEDAVWLALHFDAAPRTAEMKVSRVVVWLALHFDAAPRDDA